MKYRFKNFLTTSPSDIQPGDCFGFKIVAVAGYDYDWAAYIGLTDWEDEQVVRQGDKLLEEQAEPLFYIMRASGRYYRT